jgi:hypothetical protein
LLKKIEQSIDRIDLGDYGYCDETGEPIGVGRLIARPTATLIPRWPAGQAFTPSCSEACAREFWLNVVSAVALAFCVGVLPPTASGPSAKCLLFNHGQTRRRGQVLPIHIPNGNPH